MVERESVQLLPMTPRRASGTRLTAMFRALKARRLHRGLSPVARAVRERRLTYLRPERLRALERCAARVNRERVAGDFLEAGLALGGSAIVLAAHMGAGRRFHGYDVFGM